MVNVPLRALALFAAMVNWTLPLPLPLAPEVTVIQAAPLVAVHAQPAAVVTATGNPAPPAAAIDWLVGAIVYEQLGGAAA